MAESNEDRVTRLLSEGLDAYGDGQVSEAILTWQQVLAFDPDNLQARDYIDSADRRRERRPDSAGGMVAALAAILKEANTLMVDGDFRGAYSLLFSASSAEFANFELDATIELLRGRLLKEYRSRLGDLAAVPVISADPNSLVGCDLPTSAGFFLSLIDGATSLADLISISGMDSFEALRTLDTLFEVGLLEVPA